ncbi:MAG TPA: C2 family cysteine protease [Casimicrobiaceae bacterium]
MSKRTWSPNPYAVAQLLLGKNVEVRDWESARRLLEDAFKVKRTVLFDPDGAHPPRFNLFQAIADRVGKRMRFETVWTDPLVRTVREIYGDAAVRRVLPFLIPIDDSAFRKPGAPAGAAQFVGEYRPVDEFMIDDASFLDPIQGSIADCYLISSLIALAWVRPPEWQALLDGSGVPGAGSSKFRFNFFAADSAPAAAFDAPGDVPFDDQGRQCFARSLDPREGWTSVVEKAYVMQRCGNVSADPQPADYQMVGNEGVDPQEACQMLVGGRPKHLRNLELKAVPNWHHIGDRCDTRGVAFFPTMAWTWDNVSHLQGLTFDRTGLIPNHAYAVLGTATLDGKSYVMLRNPHGISSTGPDQPPEYATGTWQIVAASDSPTTVSLNEQGTFGLPIEWLNICFDAMGWVER